MNNLEDKNILTPEFIFTIDKIVKQCPHVIFGGSIALNAVGLISREIHDLDIFFDEDESLVENGIFTIRDQVPIGEHDMSETFTRINGKEIQRIGISIEGTKVCIFKVEKEELQYSLFKFSGRTIKIQNVNYAVQAKVAYNKNRSSGKHRYDLVTIYENLGSKDHNFIESECIEF